MINDDIHNRKYYMLIIISNIDIVILFIIR